MKRPASFRTKFAVIQFDHGKRIFFVLTGKVFLSTAAHGMYLLPTNGFPLLQKQDILVGT
jgi:hypothetical protein